MSCTFCNMAVINLTELLSILIRWFRLKGTEPISGRHHVPLCWTDSVNTCRLWLNTHYRCQDEENTVLWPGSPGYYRCHTLCHKLQMDRPRTMTTSRPSAPTPSLFSQMHVKLFTVLSVDLSSSTNVCSQDPVQPRSVCSDPLVLVTNTQTNSNEYRNWKPNDTGSCRNDRHHCNHGTEQKYM
jgi:hypothetical protein